jgi:WD40 repeat protein
MVRIWDIRTGQLLRRVRAHRDFVYDVAFMPNGKALVSGSEDRALKYWGVSSSDTTRFFARSPTTNDLDSRASGVETRPEREFLGHEVRWFYSHSFRLL